MCSTGHVLDLDNFKILEREADWRRRGKRFQEVVPGLNKSGGLRCALSLLWDRPFGVKSVRASRPEDGLGLMLYSTSGFTSLPTASCYYLMHVHYIHQYMYPCLSICGVPKISLPTTVLSALLMTALVRPARRLTSSLICRPDS